MCGIAGIVGARAGDRAALELMTRTMTHRGPDDEGYWHSDHASVGMRRLSIIDVAHGQQPYTNESGSIIVVFNGEIYNHAELRTRLEVRGHRLASMADGEVIAHLYEDDPEDFMAQLDGMFAIAIVDRAQHRLTLVRDRWGKKPLLYSQFNGSMTFASEMRALLASPLLPPSANEESIGAYLTLGYVPAPYTAINGILQLPAGSVLRADLDGQIESVTRWWSPIVEPDTSLTLEDAVDQLEVLLLEAVRKRLQSERPLGIFLSGGVDSSLIAAAAVRVSSDPVRTFSIGFDDPAYDESQHAQQVATALGTRHGNFNAADHTEEILGGLADVLDQPFADSSLVPTLLLSRMAREQVVVALGGDGGDELFGGYVRYRAVPSLQRMQSIPGGFEVARAMNPVLQRAIGERRASRLRASLSRYPTLQDRYLATMSLNPLRHSTQAEQAFASAWNSQPGLAQSLRPRTTDFLTYLPSDICFKADIATMAFGLELRSPLLDQAVSAFALTFTDELLFANGGKPVLKALARRWIPGFDADRPKMGFGMPMQGLVGPSSNRTDAALWAEATLDRWRGRWLPASITESSALSNPADVHIVEVIHGLNLGGTESALVRRLRHQPPNVRTTVICVDPSLDHFNAEVSALADDLITLGNAHQSQASLISMIRALNPDVIVSHTPRVSFRILSSNLSTEVPVIVVANASVSSSKRAMQPVVSMALRSVNRRAVLHIASSTPAAHGSQCKGARQIAVLPLGAELEPAGEQVTPWPSKTRIRLLSLNRLTYLKNLPTLVDAVADEATIMREAGANLAILGEGPAGPQIQARISKRGVADIVRLAPAMYPPTAALLQADALIVSSLQEGGPVTVYEALLAGTRITSTPVGVCSDVLVDDPGLIVLTDSSRESLRLGIRRTLEQGPLGARERELRAASALVWDSKSAAQQFYSTVLGEISVLT
ncbi:MAG: asparagine synthase (glutamine-hydrolyzing) [Actinomycetota bacterium]|nr:asparagine synthase (glutamine-hydrolyzing) [Actinomycetota bacterium]